MSEEAPQQPPDTSPAGEDPPVSGELLPARREPEARPIERLDTVAVPAPVVAATGGFLAGFAALVFVRILRGGRRSGGVKLGRGRRGGSLDVAASRSFLVDVHVLNKR
jgi:hypothetical protein